MKIVIVGAGNMGSVFAARLIDGGHDVALVARGKRLQELQTNGLRLRHQLRKRIEQHRPPVHPELTPELEADLILVMVQRPQVDALLDALEAHPAPRVCFLFNCSQIDDSWQQRLGARLVWGFPSALGATTDGIVEYLVLPGWLRFLQITTVGVAGTGDTAIARELADLFNRAEIATTYEPDMRGWLITHTGLMLPGMAVAERKHNAGRPQSMSFAEALQMARAQKECWRVQRAAGSQVKPLNIRLLTLVPAPLVAAFMSVISRTPNYSRAVLGHVDHAHEEMMAHMDGGLSTG